MKYIFLIISIGYLITLLSGCRSNTAVVTEQLSDEVYSLYVPMIANKTIIPDIDSELHSFLRNEIILNGRFTLIDNRDKAQVAVVAQITEYVKQPIPYPTDTDNPDFYRNDTTKWNINAGHVDEHYIGIAVVVMLVDPATEALLRDTTIHHHITYFTITPPVEDEETARARLFERTARSIVQWIDE